MKTREFEHEGKTGYAYSLEDGDVVLPLFTTAKPFGNFGKYSVQICKDNCKKLGEVSDGDKVYLTLTKTQGEQFNNLGLKIGEKIKAVSYDNKYGKFVKVIKA